MSSEAQPLPASTAIPVCGIGASAGGIEALQQFFSALPPDVGLACVVVVHLAPDRKSELPSILSRWTPMRVVQVADHAKEPLAANTVYVIAPDRKLEITDSSVGASAFEQPRGRRTAIDLFFRSLAEARGDGFAVVLSGSGSDGALGAKAIKQNGGVVLVQDPGSAAHGEMPGAVVATGAADIVLPANELAQALVQLARSKSHMPTAVRNADASQPIPDDEMRALKGVLDVLRRRTGHDFSKYKRATVLRRLSRRMQLTHKLSIADYLQHLREQPEEAHALLDDLLISVTTFFRDPETWAALQTKVISRLLDLAEPDEQIRAWVVGCATGEEAYSLAILFAEEFARRKVQPNLMIFASDVDDNALAFAREGLYPQSIEDDISPERLARYFRVEDEHYRVVGELRDRVVFATHNVLRDPPFSRLHLITCRNLLIYLDRELQEQVMGVFRYTCREQGYLLLGSSETADEELFTAVDKKHRIYGARPREGSGMLPELLAAPGMRMARMARELPSATRVSASEIHLGVLEEIAPPSVVVDDRWSVVHLSSSAARFFQQGGGALARRVTDLVRSQLRDELHGTLHRAAEQSTPVLSQFVAVQFDDSQRRVAVLAQKRSAVADGRTHFLITFLDAGEAHSDNTPADGEPNNEMVRGLREKLRLSERSLDSMRDDHFATNEDLRAANEELQSLNEEYRSTTEELETSKEELQSINEELQTVNNELKLKLDEVSRAHSDLENLMSSTDVATLFLDRELRIKRFTPRLGEIFSIKPRDHDRPIGDLTHTLDYPALESDAGHVLREVMPIERSIGSRSGQTFIARLRPYRISGGREIDGVVITFFDVSALKNAEMALRESEHRLEDELALMRRLHRMTLAVATAAGMSEALEQILAAAIELHGADFGNLQLLERSSGSLRIVAQHGFDAAFLARFDRVGADDAASCARALRTRAVVRIEDVDSDPGYATCRGAAHEAGYRAVQSMPLLGRDGAVLGVLSVHFRVPHAFSERDRQLTDLLAQQAAALVEGRAQQESLGALNNALQQRSAELEASQAHLSRHAAELVAQDRNRDDFLAALGHELRNPLAAIHNSLSVMSASDERSRLALAVFQRQVKNITRLVNDLLDSMRVKHGRLRLERQAVDLGQCALSALETVRALALAKHIALEFDPPQKAIVVDADPDRLAQILDNILRNAVSYTDKGRVTLELECADDGARVTVRDTGIGIDPRDAGELFKPYEQRDSGGRGKGLGLGLTLAKALVEGHGGMIGFDSDGPGKGSAFWFTLPLAKRNVQNTPIAGSGPLATRRRILLVDDNRDVAESTKVLLEHLGQSVQVAFDGASALAGARDFHPQVAILDLSMPVMSGTELARLLRSQYPERELTLVAFTGRSDAEAEARNSGCQHFLVKPVDIAALTALLNALPFDGQPALRLIPYS